MKFFQSKNTNVLFNEEYQCAAVLNTLQDNWLYSEDSLKLGEEFLLHVIEVSYCDTYSFQLGVVQNNPCPSDSSLSLLPNATLKNSWILKNNIFSHFSEDNNQTSEEYDLNLLKIQEGDIIGIKLSQTGELCYTYNGVSMGKVAEGILNNLWVVLNLTGNCSVVCILPSENPIVEMRKKNYKFQLDSFTDSNVRCEFDAKRTRFHEQCGGEIELLHNQSVARRKNPIYEFRNAVIISKLPLETGKMIGLRIEGTINKWNGSIEFGVTRHDPDETELPATLTNLRAGTLVMSGNSILTNGHTTRSPYAAKSLDDLKIGDTISVKRKDNGSISFYINGKDLGVAGYISTDTKVWLVADLYGRTIKVSMFDLTSKNSRFEVYGPEKLNINRENKLKFHSYCGTNIKIIQNGETAMRKNDDEFNNGIVFTNRPVRMGECFSVLLTKTATQWAGDLEIGITSHHPESFYFPITMTDETVGINLMFTSNGVMCNGMPITRTNTHEYVASASFHPILKHGMPIFTQNSLFTVQLVSKTEIKFFINGADLGVITLKKEVDEVFGVSDLYGKASEIHISYDEFLRKKKPGLMMNYDDIMHEVFSTSTEFRDSITERLYETDQSFLRLLEEDFMDHEKSKETSLLNFHKLHSQNITLLNNNTIASRPSEFGNALVMSSRPLRYKELFEITVEDLSQSWSGSLEMGITTIRPEQFNFLDSLSQVTKDCWVLSGSNLLHNGFTFRNDYPLHMDHLQKYSKVGLIHMSNGDVHFYLNGEDMGLAFSNVPSDSYAIMDLYGKCTKLSISPKCGTEVSEDVIQNRELYPGYNTGFFDGEFTGESDTNRVNANKDFIHFIQQKTSSPVQNSSFSQNLASHGDCQGKDRYRKLHLFNELIYGSGIKTNDSNLYYVDNKNGNCVIQSTIELKNNSYHELLFYHDPNRDFNMSSLSFGITTDKFNSAKYLPDNLTHFISPNWLVCNGDLYVDSKISVPQFSLDLLRLKKNMVIGLHLFEMDYLQIYVDGKPVDKLLTKLRGQCYLIIDLRGWYNTFLPIGSISILDIQMHRNNQNRVLIRHLTNDQSLSYKELITSETKSDEDREKDKGSESVEQSVNGECKNNNDGSDVTAAISPTTPSVSLSSPSLPFPASSSTSLDVEIIDQLKLLLKRFMNNVLLADTEALYSTLFNTATLNGHEFYSDILGTVRSKLQHLISNNLGSKQDVNRKTSIRDVLITELASRFSSILHPQSYKLNNLSRFQVARRLCLKVRIDSLTYKENHLVIIPRNSKLKSVDGQIVVNNSRDEKFGLFLLSQTLNRYSDYIYKLQLQDAAAGNGSGPNILLGLLLIPSIVLNSPDDVLKFLQIISVPKRIEYLESYINHQLCIQSYECPCIVMYLDDRTVYMNGKQIRRDFPISLSSVTSSDSLNFMMGQENSSNDTRLDFGSENYISLILEQNKGTVSTKQCGRFINFSLLQSNFKGIELDTRFTVIPFAWVINKLKVIVTRNEIESKSSFGINSNTGTGSAKLEGDGARNDSGNLEKYGDRQEYIRISHKHKRDSDEEAGTGCEIVQSAQLVKSTCVLPDMYFVNCDVGMTCFCSQCHSSGNNCTPEADLFLKGDPAKEFKLPLGFVKFSIRLKKEQKNQLNKWHLSYLTVSHGYLHQLLSTSDPITRLLNTYSTTNTVQSDNVMQLLWLKSPSSIGADPTKIGSTVTSNSVSSNDACRRLVVSPWQPLEGCFLNQENTIEPLTDAHIKYFSHIDKAHLKAFVALEVRVKPNSYKSIDFKNVVAEFQKEKQMMEQESKDNKKKDYKSNSNLSINQKTVWILNGEPNSLIISGLLIKV